MFNIFNSLSQQNKGFILMIAGLILLFHTMGIIERGLYWVIILGSIWMIGGGFMMAGLHTKIMSLMKKDQQPMQPK